MPPQYYKLSADTDWPQSSNKGQAINSTQTFLIRVKSSASLFQSRHAGVRRG